MSAEVKRSILQLSRLERIMDVVFALVIWRLFTFLPTQKVGEDKWASVSEMLIAEWQVFVFVLLAVVIVIIYWLQNNSLLGNLKKTVYSYRYFNFSAVFYFDVSLLNWRRGTCWRWYGCFCIRKCYGHDGWFNVIAGLALRYAQR